MRGSAIAASIALAVIALSAAPALAQAVDGQAQPAQPPAPFVQPPQAAPPLQAPPLFPAGAKIAFFSPQVVFQASSEGKAAVGRVNLFILSKQKEADDKAKLLQGNQQKLQTSGSVMNETARTQLEKEIEKQTKDAERFQQDAQAEVQELQQEVQGEFLKKLSPIIDQLANEKGLHLVFNAGDAGIAWAAPGLDLTSDVIKKLDAVAKPAAPPK
jgi:Skp family chaperone for outer membrane proteins